MVFVAEYPGDPLLQLGGLLWAVRRVFGDLPSLLGVGSSPRVWLLLLGLGMLLAHCLWLQEARLPGHHHLQGAPWAPYTSGGLWSCCIATQEVPPFSPQHCKVLASTKGSSFWVSLKSLVPRKSWCGRKSCQPRPWMLIEASHQPATSSWTVGSLKAMACFLAASCTMSSVSPSVNSIAYRVTWIPATSWGPPVLVCVHPDPLPRAFYGVWCTSASGPGLTCSHRLVWHSGTGLWLGSSHRGVMTLVITITGWPWETCCQGGRWTWSINPLISGISLRSGPSQQVVAVCCPGLQ